MRYSFSRKNQSNDRAKILVPASNHSCQNAQLYVRGSLTYQAFYCGGTFNAEN